MVELAEASITAKQLRDVKKEDNTDKFSLLDLATVADSSHVTYFSVSDLATANYAAVELKAHFSVSQLAEVFTLVELAEASITAKQLRDVTKEDNTDKFSLLDLATVASSSHVTYFSVIDLAIANYTASELKNLTDGQTNLFTLPDLYPTYSAALLKPLYTLSELLYSSGSTGIPLSELVLLYTTSELKTENVLLEDLAAENVTVSQLRAAPFTAYELLNLTDTQFSLTELNSGGYTALDLHDAGVSLKRISTAGYSLKSITSVFGKTQSLVTKLNTALESTSESISTHTVHTASEEDSPTVSASVHDTVSVTYANITRSGLTKQIRDAIKTAVKDEYITQLELDANTIYVELDATDFKFYISYLNEGADISSIQNKAVMDVVGSQSFITAITNTIVVEDLPVGENLNGITSEPAVSPTYDAQYIDYSTKITYPNVSLSSLNQQVQTSLKTSVKNEYISKGFTSDKIIIELREGSLEIYVTILDESVTTSTIPICFVKGTPITTNQGTIAIEKLIPGKHTIRGNSIVAITSSRPLQKHIVCFEKNSLGKNIPSRQTLVSKEHKVLYNGTMTKARDLVNLCENVTNVHYNSEMLYNVLLEKHENMNVNNMICETLDPKSVLAKISRMEPSNEKFCAMQRLNKIVKNKSTVEYTKLYASLK